VELDVGDELGSSPCRDGVLEHAIASMPSTATADIGHRFVITCASDAGVASSTAQPVPFCESRIVIAIITAVDQAP
jgi:hypothetical protein